MYKMPKQEVKVSKILIFLLLSVFLGLFLGKHTSAQEEDYIEGTKCPVAPEGMASICGQVSSSLPLERTNDYGEIYYETGQPLKGVSVYTYECDENSPTCKIDGNLVNSFGSTSTNDEGMYHITTRKVGNINRRYIVFACGGQVKKTYRIPSFVDLPNFHVFINCPEENIPERPPKSLAYVDRGNQLSCQAGSELLGDDENLDAAYTPEDIAHNVYVEGEETPDTTVNFYVDLKEGDIRFDSTVPGDPLLSRLLAESFLQHTPIPNPGPQNPTLPNGGAGGPVLGAFWSGDCAHIYGTQSIPGIPDTDYVLHGTTSEITDYCYKGDPTEIYTNESWKIQNKFPNIPPAETLLFYREYTPRQDIVGWHSNPTSGATFNLTHFGNCAGNVFLRYQNQEKEENWMSCERLKECINMDNHNPEEYLNAFTTGGYARNQAIPFENEKRFDSIVDMNTKICKIEGRSEPITVGQIEPPKNWEIHEEKEYTLDDSYFNSELIYLFGQMARTVKYGQGFESQNDSVYGSDHNPEPFKAKKEAAGDPAYGGTDTYITNGGKYQQNNSWATNTELASGAVTGMEPITNIIALPYETEEQRKLPTKSIAKIVDLSEGIDHCLRSKVNTESATLVTNSSDDNKLWINNIFRGNDDHHPLDFLTLSDPASAESDADGKKGTRTPTSALFFTSVAKERSALLKNKGNWGNELYDNLLTPIYGDGTVDWSKISVKSVIAAFLRTLGTSTDQKTFTDRNSTFTIGDTRDSMVVNFELSEENFTNEFPLPTRSNLQWGAHHCYPWHPLENEGETCGTYTEGQDNLSRTCKVYSCDGTMTETLYDVRGDIYKVSESPYNCNEDEVFRCAQEQTTKTNTTSWDDELGLKNYKKEVKCVVARAGPYVCSADLEKDANLHIKQEMVTDAVNSNGYKANETTQVDNYRYQAVFGLPYSQNVTFLNGADIDSFTSADDNVSEETKGNETIFNPGATGIMSMNMQTTALPTSFNVTPEYEDINYHCLRDVSYISPDDEDISWLCPILPVPNPEIIDPNDLQGGDSCGLNLTSECKNLIGVQNPSDTFVKIMDSAAAEFDVPASVLLAYMDYIHKLPAYAYYFDGYAENYLKDASLPWYGSFSDCDEIETQAIGPYDWIEKWFDGAVENTRVKTVIRSLSNGREETLSRCNFLDATYVTAAVLGDKGRSCGDWNYQLANSAIMALAWGENPVGQNAVQSLGSDQIAIFNACR